MTSGPRLSLIVAVATNGVIGRDGGLPWRLPADLKWFKDKTMGHHVVMGRRTYASLGGHPLPGRTKIVLTSSEGLDDPTVAIARSLDAAIGIAAAAGDDEVFVIGGAGVYREALPRADRIYLTRVHADVNGDVVLPALASEPDGFTETFRETHPADERHAYGFSFLVLERSP